MRGVLVDKRVDGQAGGARAGRNEMQANIRELVIWRTPGKLVICRTPGKLVSCRTPGKLVIWRIPGKLFGAP